MTMFHYEVNYNDNVIDSFTSASDAYACAAIYSLDKTLQAVFVQLVFSDGHAERNAVFVKGIRVWSELDIKN